MDGSKNAGAGKLILGVGGERHLSARGKGKNSPIGKRTWGRKIGKTNGGEKETEKKEYLEEGLGSLNSTGPNKKEGMGIARKSTAVLGGKKKRITPPIV